jgi:CBS-domain-containing membrane protein
MFCSLTVFINCSVVGLNFDFLVLNLTKHSSYLIYNAALFFSPVIQKQYHDKFGDKEVRHHLLFPRCHNKFAIKCDV